MAARSVIRAFAVGLWLGGLGGAVATWLILRHPARQPATHSAPTAVGAAVANLEQENARLRAETRRLEETVSELKAWLEDFAGSAEAGGAARASGEPLRVVRRWADAVESDPQAAEQLRALFRGGEADAALLRAAIEAVAEPSTNVVADWMVRMNLLADFAELPQAREVQGILAAAQERVATKLFSEGGARE
ncbi:MAG: hypothetical protein RMK20_15235 [Verrucomicrobiales bacterium]|nr:hypothetical protein [Verrucomicrobiales bacterium]